MKVVNLFGDEWDFDGEENPEGYRRRARQVGSALGGELLGATLYELPPGERTWPYHFEHGNEEWLLCVSGRPTLRTPEGELELEPGDVVWFRRGSEGAHQVSNRSDGPARCPHRLDQGAPRRVRVSRHGQDPRAECGRALQPVALA